MEIIKIKIKEIIRRVVENVVEKKNVAAVAFTPMAVQIILMVLVNSMVVDEVDEVDGVDEVDEVEEVAKEEVDSKIDQCQKLYRKFHKIKNKMGKFVVCNGLLGRNYLQQVQTR